MLQFQKANSSDFAATRQFYWDVIEDIHKNNTANENLGWEKGVYPLDDFIQTSLEKGELYTLAEGGVLYACVILNSECNEGYLGCPWGITCEPEEVLIPHALAVHPRMQGKDIGKIVVGHVLDLAEQEHKKAVRLDVLGACKAAEALYRSCGFAFVAAKNMYYEDTGWTEYRLFERNLPVEPMPDM